MRGQYEASFAPFISRIDWVLASFLTYHSICILLKAVCLVDEDNILQGNWRIFRPFARTFKQIPQNSAHANKITALETGVRIGYVVGLFLVNVDSLPYLLGDLPYQSLTPKPHTESALCLGICYPLA